MAILLNITTREASTSRVSIAPRYPEILNFPITSGTAANTWINLFSCIEVLSGIKDWQLQMRGRGAPFRYSFGSALNLPFMTVETSDLVAGQTGVKELWISMPTADNVVFEFEYWL